MRRAQQGNNYSAYGNGVQGDSHLESENDRLTDELKSRIDSLKKVTIEIGAEVRSQNQYLNDMDDEFDSAGGFLGKAMGRVKKLAKGSQNHIVLYLVIFSLVVFLFIWLIIKFSS